MNSFLDYKHISKLVQSWLKNEYILDYSMGASQSRYAVFMEKPLYFTPNTIGVYRSSYELSIYLLHTFQQSFHDTHTYLKTLGIPISNDLVRIVYRREFDLPPNEWVLPQFAIIKDYFLGKPIKTEEEFFSRARFEKFDPYKYQNVIVLYDPRKKIPTRTGEIYIVEGDEDPLGSVLAYIRN